VYQNKKAGLKNYPRENLMSYIREILLVRKI